MSNNISKCTALYESTRGELIIRVIRHDMSSTASTEEREDGGYLYTNNGVEYYIATDLGWSKVGWKDGLNSYVISGQVTQDELKKIINSIREE